MSSRNGPYLALTDRCCNSVTGKGGGRQAVLHPKAGFAPERVVVRRADRAVCIGRRGHIVLPDPPVIRIEIPPYFIDGLHHRYGHDAAAAAAG